MGERPPDVRSRRLSASICRLPGNSSWPRPLHRRVRCSVPFPGICTTAWCGPEACCDLRMGASSGRRQAWLRTAWRAGYRERRSFQPIVPTRRSLQLVRHSRPRLRHLPRRIPRPTISKARLIELLSQGGVSLLRYLLPDDQQSLVTLCSSHCKLKAWILSVTSSLAFC